jgi:hypothetical protein
MSKWRCYICGEPIGVSFTLFSLQEETDRVFLCCGDDTCLARMADSPILVNVSVETNQ